MILIDLIYNLAVMVAISVFSGFIDQRFDRSLWSGRIFQGLLFGTAAIVGMLYPFQFAEGLIFDGRSIVISLATYFFGPVSGLISALMAAVYRYQLGGVGSLMGILVVVTSFLIGWGFHFYRFKLKIMQPKLWQFLLLGMLVHLVMIVLIMTLPSGIRNDTFHIIGFTVLGIYPIVTVIIAKILLDQELNNSLFKQISENAHFFRTTLYSIGDGVITTDTKGKILQINPMAEAMIGYRENEIKGKHIGEVIQFRDELTGEMTTNPISAALEQHKKVGFASFVIVDAHGVEVPVADSAAPILDDAGNTIGAVMVFRNRSNEIERQKQWVLSAKAYRALFNSIKGAAYVQDREGKFLDVNDGALAMYGYPREMFIGNTPAFLSAENLNDMEALEQHIKDAFKGKNVQFEYWGKKANGEIFPKEVNLFKTLYFEKEAIIAIAQDVSERKKAENELRISQERYRTLFDASPVGIILEDLNGIILEVNQTICKEYEYKPEELIGKSIELLVPESHRHEVGNNISAIINNKVLHSRVESVGKKGRLRIAELIETLINLPDGRQGILSISKDITEKVIAERKTSESESRFKAIVSAIPDIFFRIDQNGRFIDCVARNADLLLMPIEQIINRSVDEILPPSLAKLTREKITISIKTGNLLEYDYSLIQSGKKQWYDARMMKSGEREVLVIVRNITDRKQAEIEINKQKRLIETLLDSIPNPLFYMDYRGIYLGVNKAFTQLFECSKEEIIGKNLFEIDQQDVALRNVASDQRIFDGKDKIQTIERELTLPNGDKIDVILTKSPFPDESGNIGGLIGLIVDITERKRMEIDLTNTRNRALESDRLKTSFLNNLNHEIRTPLNAIVGFSDLLFDDYSDSEKQNFVEVINNNAEQLLRIIDDVLAVSRLESENIPLDKSVFSIKQVLSDLRFTFNEKAAKAGLNLEIESLPDNEKDTCFHDKGKIRQVMSGFIINALKYTTEGHIRFGCFYQNNALRFYVKDTGIGIPELEQSQVFDRFFRGSQPQKMAIRGNGLGLSIARGLVEVMGGTIGLESTVGVGSTFYFDLPWTLEKLKTPELPSLLNTAKFLADISILIAEDEVDNYEYLHALLADKVATIDRARNGVEAYELHRLNNYDLILMDIKMPEMNGLEATRQIMNAFPKSLIIAQTAFSQPDEIQKAMEAGCKACVIKPIDKQKLFRTLKDVLEGSFIAE